MATVTSLLLIGVLLLLSGEPASSGGPILYTVMPPTEVSVMESATDVMVCPTISPALTGVDMVVVNVTTTSGTAMENDDYTPTTDTLTFSDLLTPCVTVPIVDMPVVEGNETFTLNFVLDSTIIADSTATANVSPTTTTVVIQDDDTITVSFSQASYSVTEGGTVQVCATIDSGSVAIDVTVGVSVTEGTAVAADFSGVMDITFLAGEASGAANCFLLMAVDDTSLEDDMETFTLTLESNDDVTIGTTASTTVTIVDNDMVTVAVVGAPSETVPESQGMLSVCVSVSPMAMRDVTVNLETMDGTATAGEDYTAINMDLTIPAGDMMSCMDISILNDVALEGDETFTVTLTATADDVTPMTGSDVLMVTIEADATDVVMVTVPATATVEEDDDMVMVCVTFTGTLGRDLVVMVATQDGTARAGDDYTALSMSLTFTSASASGSTQCVTVMVNNDMLLESNETFSVVLTTEDTSATVTNSMAMVTILAGDSVTIGFEEVEVNVEEGNNVSVCVTVSGGGLGRDVQLDLTTQDTSATVPATVPATLTVLSGTTRACLMVNAPLDDILEDNEGFNITLTTTVPGVTLDPDTATVTVVDTTVVTIGFGMAEYNVGEGMVLMVCVSLMSPGVLARETMVTFTTMDASAMAPEDYIAASETLSFDADNSMRCVDINTTANEVLEDIRMFTVQLSTIESMRVNLNPDAAPVTIVEDDAVVISVESPVMVVESEVARISLNVTEGTLGRNLLINASTVAGVGTGIATEGADYMALDETLTFSPTVTRVTVMITTLTDSNTDENSETFNVDFVNVDSSIDGLVTLEPATSTVTIIDAPFIAENPQDQFVLLGDDAEFQITAMGFEITYQWLFGGEALVNSDRVQGANTTTLTIMNVSSTDFGNYSCRVSSVVSTITSREALLAELMAPEIVDLTNNTGVLTGDDITLNCTARSPDGLTNLQVNWSTPILGVTLPAAVETVLSDTTVVSSLPLTSLSMVDSGMYICTVSNRASEVDQPVNIAVITIFGVQNQTVTIGNNVTLFCNATTNDQALTYAWERVLGSVSPSRPFGGDDLPSDLPSRLSGEGTSMLTITNVAFDDGMDYRCNVSAFRKLVGFAVGDLITQRAEIIEGPTNTTLGVGETLVLTCTARNNTDAPNPLTFTWVNTGRVLSMTDNRIINETAVDNQTVTSQLTVPAVTRDDAGTYICSVHNRQPIDEVVSEGTDVVVRFSPIVNVLTSEGGSGGRSRTFRVPVGGNETVQCVVDAVPPPDFIELSSIRGGAREVILQMFPENQLQRYREQTLVEPTSLEETGTVYLCIAGNAEGNGTDNLTLIVQAVPEMVNHSLIQETLINLLQVRLTWPEPEDNAAPITDYIITFCVVDLSTNTCIPDSSVNIDVMPQDIDRISPGMASTVILPQVNSRIRVGIVAVNSVGAGLPSPDAFYFDTFTEVEAQAINLETVIVTSDSAVLSWDLPLSATNGESVMLSQFVVTVTATGGAGDPTVVMVTEGVEDTTYGVTLTELTPPGGSYDVMVVADYSVPDLTTPPTTLTFSILNVEDPIPPLVNIPGVPGFRDAETVSLSWTLPDDDEFLMAIVVTVTSTSLVDGTQSRRRRQGNEIRLGPRARSVTVNVPPYSDNRLMVDAELMPPGAAAPLRTPLIGPVSIESLQGAATPPTMVDATPNGFFQLDLAWVRPAQPNGEISDYQINFGIDGQTGGVLGVARTIIPRTEYSLPNLLPNTRYRITVQAYTNLGSNPGQLSDPIVALTAFGVAPSTVMHFRSPVTNGIFTLVISLNNDFGPIDYFQVIVTTSNTIDRDTLNTNIRSPEYYVAYQDDVSIPQINYDLGTGSSFVHRGVTYNNIELRGNTDYYVFIRAFSRVDQSVVGNGPFSTPISFTPSLNTVAIIVPIAAIAVILLVVLVVLLLFAYFTMNTSARRRGGYTPRNGLLEDGKRKNKGGASMELRRTRLFSPVLNVGSPDVFTSAGQPTTLICEASGTPAPEVTWTHNDEPLDKERFIQLADGSLFINDTDLQDEGTYVVRATNSAGEAESAVRVTVLRPVPPDSDMDHAPIKVGEFSQKIALVRAEDDEGLEDEYAEVELDWTFTSYAAKLNINKNKNRYINIIPYDHSRVVLSLQDNTPGSDYINASFVDAFQRPNGYIASQGPIPSTFPDFWRMVWELDSPTIVMVTNLKEEDKVKCHQYWPSYGTTTYGNIQVTLKEVENLAEYSIRTFNVSPLAGQSRVPMPVREVRQFHFLVWPDHGVPQYATNLLSFRKRILKYHPEKRGPMVVHCSAGVGRTGTFITIDYMLKQIEAEGTIDIFNFVRHMRYRRNYMVQTSPQYVFIHDALLESIMCGDNSIKAPEMRDKVKELMRVIQETGLPLFQTQFNTLSTASPPDDDFDCSIAQLPDNMAKNRFKEHLPANDYRVVLSADGDQSDYICASYVDNYRERNAFIVTQAPMTDTVADFWRMMWETKSAAIVMLTELQEGDQEMCVKYWPSGVSDPNTYGGYQVELSEEEKDRGSYITRRFKLSMLDKPQESRMVSQFHFTKWTKTTPPTDCRPIIDLIDELQRVQRKSGNMPITVHCDDGVSRTGAFCALYSVLERVKTEQIVDVFQAVKTLRIQRAGLLGTIEEYEFVHRAVIEFLDTFSDYQNFK